MLPLHLECERDSEIDKICQLESRSLRWVPWHAYAWRTRSAAFLRRPRRRRQILQALLTLMASLLLCRGGSHAGKIITAIIGYHCYLLADYHCSSLQSLAQKNNWLLQTTVTRNVDFVTISVMVTTFDNHCSQV